MNTSNLIIIDDMSGSRIGQEQSDKEGIDSMINQQKSILHINCNVTMYRFNADIHKIHDKVPINDFPPVDIPRFQGATALYDTIGHVINKFDTPLYQGDGKVLCIITDGLDTASRKYGTNQIKQMIATVKQKGWQIMYLSENVETMQAGQDIGISADPTDCSSYNVSTGHGRLGATMSCRTTNTALTRMLYTSSGYDPQ